MAAELKEVTGVEPELKYGAKGDFEVMVDGKKIFSMQEKGRFPEEKEVVKLLEKQKR